MKNYRYVILCFIGIVATIHLRAQSFWTGLNGPYAGANDHEVTATGQHIVATSNGLFVSTDGTTYTKATVGHNLFVDIEVSGSTVYALTVQNLYVSNDNGANWALASGPNPFSDATKVRRASDGTIYVLGSNTLNSLNQVFRSTNNGANFTQVYNAGHTVTDLLVTANKYVYVSVSQEGLYLSTDNGAHFNAINTGLSGVASGIASYNVSGTETLFTMTPTGLYKAIENPLGPTWALTTNNITDVSFGGRLTTDASNNVYYFSNASNKIYYSSNGGTTWSAPTLYPYDYTVLSAVATSPVSYSIVMSGIGILSTTNAGGNWQFKNTGIKGFGVRGLYYSPTGRIFETFVHESASFGPQLASTKGYFMSVDDGQSWILTGTDKSFAQFLTLSDNSILATSTSNEVYRSTDNGNSWVTQTLSGYSNVFSNDGVNIYALNGNGLVRSMDKGVTWNSIGTITGLSFATKAVIDKNGNFYFLNDISDKLYYSTAANPLTATEITTLGTVDGIYELAVAGNAAFVTTSVSNNGMIAKTTDGGATWTIHNSPGVIGLWAYDENNLFTTPSEPGKLLITHDGGVNWQTQSLLDGSARVKGLAVSAAGYAYVAATGSVTHKSKDIAIPPAAPSALIDNGHTYNGATIMWTDNAVNETSFEIQKSVGDNLHFQTLLTMESEVGVQDKYYYTANLDPNTKYYFRVAAINAAGKSAYSNELSLTTLQQCTSTIPDNRSWTSSTTITEGGPAGPYPGANVVIKKVPNYSNVFTVSDYSSGGLNAAGAAQSDPARAYFDESCGVTFFADNNGLEIGDGNGTWDPVTKTLVLKWKTNPLVFDLVRGVTTYTLNNADPIPQPTILKTYLYSSNEVLLNWDSKGFEQSFTIERSLASGSGYNAIATVNYPTTKYIDKDPTLTSGTTYYYRIKSNNAAGSSAPSTAVSMLLQSTLFRPEENTFNDNFDPSNGIVWGDLNDDGYEDVFVASAAGIQNLKKAPAIYLGSASRAFTRVDLDIVKDEFAINWTGVIADFNNDGKNDIYITRNSAYDLLLVNNGNMQFTKVEVKQTDAVVTSNYYIRSGAAADFDNDKFLDVYVGTGTVPGASGMLLVNNGANNFTKSLTAGDILNEIASAVDVSWADYDNDNDQDLFILNQDGANHLYKNTNGSLTKVTGLIFDTDIVNLPRTASWGDIDNDGDLDLYVGSVSNTFGYKDRMYINNGDGTFTSQTTSVAAEADTRTYGSVFADIDNDADLDLVATNLAANSIFLNNGSGGFTKSTVPEMLLNPNIDEFGISAADFDKDGFVDVFPTVGLSISTQLPHFLFRNATLPSGSRHWVEVKLTGTITNGSAIGARIKVTAGGKTQIREITSHSGNRGNSSLIAHFGLGTATLIDELRVIWSSGANTVLTNVAPDRILNIIQDYTGPVLVTLAPANLATGVSVTPPFEVTLDEVPTLVAGKNIQLLKAGSSTPINISVSTGLISGKKVSFTTPTLEFYTTYSVTIDAGAFKDQYGNASLAFTSGWSFTTLDNTPPVMTHTPTALIAKNFTTKNFSVTATDNATTPVVKMFYRDSKVVDPAPYTSLTGTLSGTTYSFTIDKAAFNGEGLHYYFVATDAASNTTRSPVGTGTHETLLDNTAPIITPENLPTTVAAGFTNLKLTATITDNLVTVVSPKLQYRGLSGSAYTAIDGVLNSSGKYDFTIPNGGGDNNGIEFYFSAADESANQSRNPASGTLKAQVLFESAAVPSTVLGFGGTEKDWKIFSLPFVFDNNDVATVLADLGETKGNARWKLLTYKDDKEWSTYPAFTTIIRGQGYFINIKDRVEVSVGANLKAPNNNRSNLFQMTLKAGWNQIGNPYLSEIIWSDVVTYNSLGGTLAELKTFAAGEYISATGLQPFEGGFVFSDAAVTITIPFKGQTSPGGRMARGPITSTDISQQEWSVPISLEQGFIHNKFTAVGMHPEASISRDEFDDFNPPRFFSYVEMNVAHPEHLAKEFARDIVPTRDFFMWEFKAESNLGGMATMNWDNTRFGDNSKELVLVDEQLQERVNMRASNSYIFDPKKSTRFRIYFGENLDTKIRPSLTTLRAFPNPAAGKTTLTYSLSDVAPSYGVAVVVYDMMGTKVASLANGTMTPGFYSTEWIANEKLPDGLYLCRLIATSAKGQEIYTEKIILTK